MSLMKQINRRKSYTIEFKLKTVQESEGENLIDFCKKRQLCPRVVRRWRDSYQTLFKLSEKGLSEKRKVVVRRRNRYNDFILAPTNKTEKVSHTQRNISPSLNETGEEEDDDEIELIEIGDDDDQEQEEEEEFTDQDVLTDENSSGSNRWDNHSMSSSLRRINRMMRLNLSKKLTMKSDQNMSINSSNLTWPLRLLLDRLEDKIPLRYACDWDNVGLLLEPFDLQPIRSIMLTNDLTERVLEEAIDKNTNLIISYHPPIFQSIKKITQNHWKERIIARSFAEKIAIYSPHTALDAITGGINDWLLKPFDRIYTKPIVMIEKSKESKADESFSMVLKSCSPMASFLEELKQKHLCDSITLQENSTSLTCSSTISLQGIIDIIRQSSSSIEIVSIKSISKPQNTVCKEGMGRICSLTSTLTIKEIVRMVKRHLKLKQLRLSISDAHTEDSPITTIAVCAGSGASILRSVEADLIITGEMSHHDLLEINHQNRSAILCEHSNTERGYLHDSLYNYLMETFRIPIFCSEVDRDPIEIV
ncbi:synergin gamma [Sarcoptes scabiei]|nr:synergin gamma [Sarcoptes scabiei]